MSYVKRNEPCFCGSGKKHKKCHNDINPESKAAKTIMLYKDIDDSINKYQEDNKVKAPCKIGCYDCCYDDFTISLVEFDLIMREMDLFWSQEEIESAYDTALKNIEDYKTQKPELFELLEVDGNKNQSAIHKQYIRTEGQNKFPCLFLNLDNGLCKIYKVRPLVCRVHGTTNFSFDFADYFVCKKIQSNKNNSLLTPNANEFLDKAGKIFDLYDEKRKFSIQYRRYPIFYMFKIYYQKRKNKEAFILEKNNFTLPLALANQLILNDFTYQTNLVERRGGK